MHLLLEICEQMKKLSATQQDKTAAVSDVHRIIHSTVAVLIKIKSEQVFLCFFFFSLYSTYPIDSKQLGFYSFSQLSSLSVAFNIEQK